MLVWTYHLSELGDSIHTRIWKNWLLETHFINSSRPLASRRDEAGRGSGARIPTVSEECQICQPLPLGKHALPNDYSRGALLLFLSSSNKGRCRLLQDDATVYILWSGHPFRSRLDRTAFPMPMLQLAGDKAFQVAGRCANFIAKPLITIAELRNSNDSVHPTHLTADQTMSSDSDLITNQLIFRIGYS